MCAGRHREMQCNSLLPFSVMPWKHRPKSFCGQLCVWPLYVSKTLTLTFTFSHYFFCICVVINEKLSHFFFRSDDEETFCRALVEYTRACSHVGYPVREWRDSFPSCSKFALTHHKFRANKNVSTFFVYYALFRCSFSLVVKNKLFKVKSKSLYCQFYLMWGAYRESKRADLPANMSVMYSVLKCAW